MSLLYIIFIQLSSLFFIFFSADFSFFFTSFLYLMYLLYITLFHLSRGFLTFFIFLLCDIISNITADNISKVKCVIVIFKTANLFISSIKYIIHTHYLFLSLNLYPFDNYNYTTSKPKVNSFFKSYFFNKVSGLISTRLNARETFAFLALILMTVFCVLLVHCVASFEDFHFNHCITQCRVLFCIVRIICNKCVHTFRRC